MRSVDTELRLGQITPLTQPVGQDLLNHVVETAGVFGSRLVESFLHLGIEAN